MFSIPHTVKRVPLAHSTIGQRCHRRACPSEARVSPPSSALQAENSCPVLSGIFGKEMAKKRDALCNDGKGITVKGDGCADEGRSS